MDNFDFLKEKNKNLFKIISEAENLFRDEYFEQSMVQTRRFAENLCIDLLGDKVAANDTFDLIINKLKDNMGDNVRLKEFVEDLYFIKKNGNESAHSGKTVNSGELALECLERAFEISIFYIHNKFGYSKKNDKLLFNEELLMTGKVTKAKTIKQKYEEELGKCRAKNRSSKKQPATRNEHSSASAASSTLKVFFAASIATIIICIAVGVFIFTVFLK